MTTMIIGAAAADRAAGTAIRRATRKPHVAAGKSGGSRGHYRDDDEDRSYARSRDDEGRFVSSRSRYDDDDDDDRRSGRRRGGWYGDPEGHSEAARRGRR
jgi:hypothetical protein